MAYATRSNYYKRSFTEYEVEACKRDAAKRAQGCDECSQTEYEVEAYNWDVADAHIFTAAPGAPAAKIEPRAVLDAEMAALAAEIAAAISASKPKTKRSAELDAVKHAQGCNECSPAAKIEPRAVLDAEMAALAAEIAAAISASKPKTKRSAELDAAKHAQGCNECSPAAKIERRAVLDAEIPALEAEIAAAKSKQADALAAKDAEITELMVEIAAAKSKRNNKLAAMDAEIAALEAELAANRS
jgi:chromosome segregation ATPase